MFNDDIHVTVFLGYFPYGKQVYLSLAVPFFALVVVNRWRQPAVVELNLIINNNWHNSLLLYWFMYLYNGPTHCNENPILYSLRIGIAWPQSQFPLSWGCERFTVYVPRIGPHIFLQQNRQTDPGNI